ncbi:hypothetical protein [Halobacterium sp. NMX12-1]|jgi:hypothetical protein|uniref:hypothetical protein n=1 Tax=Halobacterium sp. NMX12-1 TaxID=3166650 RepID=UPI00336BFA1A
MVEMSLVGREQPSGGTRLGDGRTDPDTLTSPETKKNPSDASRAYAVVFPLQGELESGTVRRTI